MRSHVTLIDCSMFIMSMIETRFLIILIMIRVLNTFDRDSNNSLPDVNSFHGETCFVHDQTEQVLA